MRRRPSPSPLVVSLLVAILLAVTACGQDPEPSPGAAPVDDGTAQDPDDDAQAPSGTVDPALEAEVETAAADLADAEGVARSDIEVVAAERVTWPDGALGCPAPDQLYTMALVEGYRIVLGVAGDEVAYHGASGQLPFRCDDPQPPVAD